MQNFEGNVVFLTGASSGIGSALAHEFASRGADLVLTARRLDRLEQLAGEVVELGHKALPIEADVTSDTDLERATQLARETFGRIDVVIANAGFGVAGLFEKLTIDDHRRQFETNVFGVMRTIYATLSDLKKSKGRLGLVGSVAGYMSLATNSSYAMSKFAVRALAEALRYELAEYGVSVTHIAPGFVESEIRKVNNRGVYKQEARDPVPPWLVMPATKAARKIADAMAKRRGEVVLTRHGKLAVSLTRHLPRTFHHTVKLVGKSKGSGSKKK